MKIKDTLYKELKSHLLQELSRKSKEVEVTSAYSLTEGELADITARLVGHGVRATNIVDPEIIAGVVVRMGSKIMDLSLRGELEAIAEHTL